MTKNKRKMTQKRKTKPMTKFDVFGQYVFYFIFGAMVGWVYEMLYCPLANGEPWVNRGFMYGPYLPIYGFGAVILLFLLKGLMKKKLKVWKINLMPVVIFVLIFLITSVLEYFAHWLIDWYFIPKGLVEQNLWDYSHELLNINGRVCFKASRNFAIIGIIAMYGVIPIYEKMMQKLKKSTRNKLIFVLLLVLAVDLLATVLL